MLEKITFRNGVILSSSTLNEVQKGTTFNPRLPRENYYGLPAAENESIWYINERDGIKDWEFSDPEIEPQSNIGRLAYDGIILGCNNCDVGSLPEEELEVEYGPPRVTYRDLFGDLLPRSEEGEQTFGVFVNSGSYLNSNGEKVSWGLDLVIVEEGLNFIYYDINNSIVVANSTLPNKTTPHIPLASLNIELLTEENDEFSRILYTDLRPGVFVYSDSKIELNNNDTIIIDDHTLSTWERIFVDTSNGSINITLPQNAVDGDRVSIFDVSGTFDVYPAILYVENNTDSTILRSNKTWELNKRFSNTELIFFEPLNIWIFNDHDLNLGERKLLGEFISCGGTECLGALEPTDCPNNQAIPSVYPNPSEGFFEYRDDGKCYKIINDSIAIYSDGEGGFIKLFNSPRCNKELTNISLTNKDSKTIYVDSVLGNDSIQNQGLSLDSPLRTIERAILEAVKGKSNYTIKLASGTYYVDNRNSSSSSGVVANRLLGFYNLKENPSLLKVSHFREKENLLVVYDGLQDCQDLPLGLELGRTIYSESGAYGTIVYAERDKKCVVDCGWRLTLEGVFGVFNSNELLYYVDFSSLNSLEGGLIIPKGISIIGSDTRKTIIRPLYVPSINNESHSHILRLSANTYISNITFGDNLSIKRSHDKLIAVSFVSQEDMIDDIEKDNRGYYYKVSSFLNDSEIITRFKNNSDSEIVARAPLDRDLRFQDVKENITGNDNSDKDGNPELIQHPGAIAIESAQTPGQNVSIPDINSSYSGSPYLKDCTVRSIFGLNGLSADGSRVSGFKSVIADSFTVISIQVDPIAYENEELSYINDPASPIYPKRFKPQRRHFAYKALNQAFIQSSAAFVIGSADHFLAEDGGEISLIGSNSSFGDTSLTSRGFYQDAFTQDYAQPSVGSLGTRISQIIPPKKIEENLKTKKVFTGFKLLYTLSKLFYEEHPDSPTYRLYVESSDLLNPLSETNPPNTNLMGEYSFTRSNNENSFYLSGGNYRRNYLYITGIDGTVYKTLPVVNENSLLDDKSKIFKYDPDPASNFVNLEQNLGVGTINRTTNSVIVTTTEFVSEIKRNSYIKIENNFYQVSIVNFSTTFTTIDLLTPLSDDLQINKLYTITALKTNIDGGKWYIEAKNEGISTGISKSFITDALASSEIKILDEQSIFIIRDFDVRAPEEKIYRVRLDGYLSELGLRSPRESYIIQKQKDLSTNVIVNSEGLPYVLTNVTQLDTNGAYYASVVNSNKYRLSLTESLIPRSDPDNPDDDSLEENITKDSILEFINDFELDVVDFNNNIVLEIVPSNEPYSVFAKNSIGSLIEFRIKLHRPSTIRSSSHQWEWVGYLSYDTALPKFQGPNFSEEETLLKYFKELEGGIIYASGTAQDGRFFINNSPVDSKKEEFKPTSTIPESRALDPQDTVAINKELRLNTGSNLYLSSNSSTVFYGNNYFLTSSEKPITIDSNSSVLATDARAGLAQLSTLEEAKASLNLVEPLPGRSTVITTEILSSDNLRASISQRGLISLATDASDGEDDLNALTPSALNNLTATSSRAGIVKLAPPGALSNLDANDIALVPSNLKDLSIVGGISSRVDICDIRLSHSSEFSFPTITNTTADPLSTIYVHGSNISLFNTSTGWFVKTFAEVLEFDCDRLLDPNGLIVMQDDETYELFLGLNDDDSLILTAKPISDTVLFKKDQVLVDNDDYSRRYVGRLTTSNVSTNNTTYLQYLGGEIDNISDPDANDNLTHPTVGLTNYYNRKKANISYIFKNELDYNYKYISNGEIIINDSFSSLVGDISITTLPESIISGNLSATSGKIEKSSNKSGKIKTYNYVSDNAPWSKNSQELDTGNAPEYKYMDMSSDGTTIAIGVRNKNGELYSGSVKIYRLSGSTWLPIPSNSTGVNQINNSLYFRGYSVALSSNGNTLVVKTFTYNPIRSKVESNIKVYDYINNSWVDRNFPALLTLDESLNPIDSPYSIDVSGDGLVVATSYYNSSTSRGQVSVYEYVNSTNSWVQKGNNILGIRGAETGWSLSLNSSGTKLAVGSPSELNNRGSVRVYEFDENSWELLGENLSILVGENDNEFYGYSLSLHTISATSEKLVIGAPGTNDFTGCVRGYSFDSSASNSWVKINGDLNGVSTGDEFGCCVSTGFVSPLIITAVGAKFRDIKGEDSGQVSIYSEKNGAPWELRGLEINGAGLKDEFGRLVSISSTATRVAVATKNSAKFKNLLINNQSIHVEEDSLTLQIKPSILDYTKNDYYTTGEISHELSSTNSIFNFIVPEDLPRVKIKYDYRICNVSDENIIPTYNESILRKYKLNTTSDDPHRKNGILVSIEV